MIRKGTVLIFEDKGPCAWGVVTHVSSRGLRVKRPFVAEGKSFIEFSELDIPLPLPKHITIIKH